MNNPNIVNQSQSDHNEWTEAMADVQSWEAKIAETNLEVDDKISGDSLHGTSISDAWRHQVYQRQQKLDQHGSTIQSSNGEEFYQPGDNLNELHYPDTIDGALDFLDTQIFIDCKVNDGAIDQVYRERLALIDNIREAFAGRNADDLHAEAINSDFLWELDSDGYNSQQAVEWASDLLTKAVLETDTFITPETDRLKQPGYLEPMPADRWHQLVDTSANFTHDFPDAVIMGGTSLRFLYVTETGKEPFGEGGGDLDTFVPAESLAYYRKHLPEGYTMVDNGEHLDDRICVRTPSGEEVDIFAWSDDYESIEVNIDGQVIRTESLTSQISTRMHLARQSDLLQHLSDDPQLDRAKRDKYGFYAQKLLEIADTNPNVVDESKLPEDWHTILEGMAAQGEYGEGDPDDPRFLEVRQHIKSERELLERQERAKAEFMESVKEYYVTSAANPATDIPEPLRGFEASIIIAKANSHTADEFVDKLQSSLTPNQLSTIGRRISPHL